MSKKVSGTKEWSKYSYNICKGCPHGCSYCYARSMAHRFKRIDDYDEWQNWELLPEKVAKNWRRRDGVIMFPTTHDIFPEILDESVEVLTKMLDAGNEVLIVSKPHQECIERLCDELGAWRDNILFRFTIGSMDDDVLGFWEPDAPSFGERLRSLAHAFYEGFATSVSCEPYLDDGIRELVNSVYRFCTDSVWIGLMNRMSARVDVDDWNEDDWNYWNLVKDAQSEDFVSRLYEDFRHDSKIRWKDSIKDMLGLDRPDEAGLDI